jgi:hypothetical protein
LDCVGLGVADPAELEQLVSAALKDAERMGEAGGIAVLGWQDPSGARMVMATRGNKVLDLLPSYAGTPGARLANVHAVNKEVAVADVLDDDGEQVAMLAVELEQRRMLPAAAGAVNGHASVVALGVDVAVHADADAFEVSDTSLLGDGGDDSADAPPHYAEQGWEWPPRMAAESFISYGVFGPPKKAQAYARLNGTVLHAQRHTVVATGQQFVVARVRTAGFEVDLCLSADDARELPRAGNVVGGTVFLVASLPFAVAEDTEARRRSWLPGRR